MKNESNLLKHTKKELVEIILRKDDVEKKLRKQLNELMNYKADLEKYLLNNNITTINFENGYNESLHPQADLETTDMTH